MFIKFVALLAFMAMRMGGNRRKTRHQMKKNVRERGKISIADYMQEFKEGDQVYLVAEPAVQKGVYFRRFHGRSGQVVGKQGKCYQILIDDLGMQKMVIVHPVHLKRGQ